LAILADRVVDCTGDADIAFLAGAEYRQTAKVRKYGISAFYSESRFMLMLNAA
jgi:hypothetical protein